MIGFIRGLAAEGAGHNIKINAVAPIAATRMLAQSLADADEVAQRRPGPEDGGTTPERMRAFVGKLDAALVSPVMAFLAHEAGEIYTAGAWQVSQFFIDRTGGYYNSALSMEDVRDHLALMRPDGLHSARGPRAEIVQLFQAIAAGSRDHD
ncbi:hypothetical protein [Nocardia vinacea]|uniref:hypothetical protein n=1 Tax=Nocardia vinacea TaxID=96468 RepID=UPI0002DFF733|nr:hypothetical protein [Nocardia vinacea]